MALIGKNMISSNSVTKRYIFDTNLYIYMMNLIDTCKVERKKIYSVSAIYDDKKESGSDQQSR